MKPSALNTIGGELIATWLAVNPANALAQGEVHAATPPDIKARPTALIPQGSIPVPEVQEPWKRRAAFKASSAQIVFHYGAGFHDADLLAEVLSEKGYTTIAVPGGPDGKMEMFVGRKMPGTYSQRELNDGTAGGDAMEFHRKYIGPPKPSEELISLAQ